MPEPAVNKPTDAEFYIKGDSGELKPNPPFLKHHFFREGRLTEAQALFILERATVVLRQEPNMVDVKSPVTSALCIHIDLNRHLIRLKYAGIFTANMCVTNLTF